MEEKNLLKYVRFSLSWIILLFGIFSCSPSNESNVVVLNGTTMGTTYQIKLVKPEGKNYKTIHAQIDSLLRLINLEMSTYIDSSEISRFNQFKDTTWFAISKDFYTVLRKALEISKMTNGAYDITVGPLVNLWGFGPENRREQIPSEKEIKERLKNVGYKNILIKENPYSVKKRNEKIYVDLSSIAKGYGVDKVAGFLDDNGFTAYMVEIGGEVRTKGKKNKSDFWKIGIQYPDGSNKISKIVKLFNLSMATSGDYYNYFEINGKRFSHTIDPRTGRPVTHNLVSVSVVDPSCATADGWATALLVLGPEEGFRFALKHNFPVIMFIHENGKYVEKSTPGFKKLIEEFN